MHRTHKTHINPASNLSCAKLSVGCGDAGKGGAGGAIAWTPLATAVSRRAPLAIPPSSLQGDDARNGQGVTVRSSASSSISKQRGVRVACKVDQTVLASLAAWSNTLVETSEGPVSARALKKEGPRPTGILRMHVLQDAGGPISYAAVRQS